ncbi:MAG: hypothetical protein ACI4P5_09745 [Candidatus Fimadaptatus sp.]
MADFELVSKTTTKTRAVAQDNFIISVAKGQTITLGKEKTFNLKCTVTGKSSAAQLGLEGNLSVKYSASSTWVGPSESSEYNSREFRVKMYENQGRYTGYQRIGGVRVGDLQSGTWTEPAGYAQYSIDSKH